LECKNSRKIVLIKAKIISKKISGALLKSPENEAHSLFQIRNNKKSIIQ